MSSSKVQPPKFINDPAEYDQYKKKLLRWTRITKVDKKLQAETVVHYLEGHPSGIEEKIDTALGDQIVDKDDGMDKLIAYLDSIYKEDDLTNMWIKYKRFVRLKKKDQQTITEFIAEFESAYKETKDNGCDISDTVLALNLLDSCCLSETDEKFVLTAVDFKKGKDEGNCLDQVKKSLRKFQSRDRISTEKDRFQVKEEDALVAEVKDALLADGWLPPVAALATGDASVRQNSPLYKGNKNKLGADGKPLRCYHCQSEYHLSFQCDQKPSADKQASTKQLPKKKGKGNTETMLSTVFEGNKKYSMVCEVTKLDDSEAADEKPMVLSDMLRACLQTSSGDEEEVRASEIRDTMSTYQFTSTCHISNTGNSNQSCDLENINTLGELLAYQDARVSSVAVSHQDGGAELTSQYLLTEDMMEFSVSAAEIKPDVDDVSQWSRVSAEDLCVDVKLDADDRPQQFDVQLSGVFIDNAFM